MNHHDEHDERQDDCGRLEWIVLREAEGQLLDPGDLAFRDAHLVTCADCRLEQRALELMAHGQAGEGPALPLSEISRRRLVNGLLARTAVPTEIPRRRGAARALGVAAALAACALLGVGAALLVADNAPGPVAEAPTVAPLALTQDAASGEVRVLLRSGEVRLDGKPLTAEQVIRAGRTLTLERGLAALRLPRGSQLLVGPGSTLEISDLTPDHVRLRLGQGELLAAVTARRPGQGFVVATPDGRVQVRGTIFGLRVEAAGTRLLVHEGRVSARSESGPPVELSASQVAALGSPPGLAAPADQRWIRRQLRVLALLDSSPRSGMVRLRSQPTAAQVAVGGVALGQTPLLAALRPGTHQLGVSLTGHAPVQERLQLEAGSLVLRDVQLSPLVASSQRPRAPVPSRARRRRPRPSRSTPPQQRDEPGQAIPPPQVQKQPPPAPQPPAPGISLKRLRQAEAREARRRGRVEVHHDNQMGGAFKLVHLSYVLDGKRIYQRDDEAGSLDRQRRLQVASFPAEPGEHTLEVRMVFRGNDRIGLFPYFKGYKFDARSSHSFRVAPGRRTTVVVTAFEKGGLATPLEELPSIRFRVR
jgi:ferric-dicitrate binding protein FerR (iron transport regulator)